MLGKLIICLSANIKMVYILQKEKYVMRNQESIAVEKQPKRSIWGSIWRTSWWKFLFFYNKKINSKDKQKRN
jgi:hypothetical protein